MISFNGEEKPFKGEMTVADFLEKEGYRTERVAVEINGSIVPKHTFGEEVMKPGDTVEVVSFVGGG